jgi:hypothetical protein
VGALVPLALSGTLIVGVVVAGAVALAVYLLRTEDDEEE